MITQEDPGLSEIISIVPGNFSGNVLDAATGVGKVVLLIARNYPDSKVWGVDLCDKAIKIARENKSSNSRFIVADSENLPFIGSFFDFVFNRFSFHHLPPSRSIRGVQEGSDGGR